MDWQRKRRPIRTCQHCNKEFKKKCRNDAMFCSAECRFRSEYNTLQLAKMRKKQAGKKINKLEMAGYEMLTNMGLKYEQQFIFGGRFVADAFLNDYNIIVQFDGDYWHGNPEKYQNLSDYQKKVKEVDQRANIVAKECGYSVIRIWESELKNHLNLVQTIILKEIEKFQGA